VADEQTKWDRALTWFCHVAFASFSFGIAIQQILLGLYAIAAGGTGMVRGRRPDWFVNRYRLPMIALVASSLLAMVASEVSWSSPEPMTFQWPMLAYWVIAPAMVARLSWVRLHRVLLIASVPGLVASVLWLLQPAELAHAMNVGFTMFPRAEGFESNPITYSEGLVVLGGWSLARLTATTPGWEGRLIKAHLGLSILIVVFSRVRSGIVGFAVLFLIHGILEPRYRKSCLIALVVMIGLFGAGTAIFGFNMASLEERIVLIRANLELIPEAPITGIGSDKHLLTLENGRTLPEHPHNTLIGVTVESGLIGLLAYLVAMIVLARQLYLVYLAHREPDDPLAWPTRALVYVFIHFHLHGLFDYNFNDTESLLMHALHWGLITELARATITPSEKKTAARGA